MTVERTTVATASVAVCIAAALFRISGIGTDELGLVPKDEWFQGTWERRERNGLTTLFTLESNGRAIITSNRNRHTKTGWTFANGRLEVGDEVYRLGIRNGELVLMSRLGERFLWVVLHKTEY